jgi:hypothetical protein
VTHTVLGVGIGAVIEGLLPSFSAGASVTNLVFETLVQVGLNGAALASVSEFLRDDDPTFGIPFSMALLSSQTELTMRLQTLGAVVKVQVAQVSQRMARQAPAV